MCRNGQFTRSSYGWRQRGACTSLWDEARIFDCLRLRDLDVVERHRACGAEIGAGADVAVVARGGGGWRSELAR